MKQKLSLCCALINDPDLLILDEPTTGVDPLSRGQFWDLINTIRARRPQMSVIVATAYMDEAQRFEWLIAMDDGKVIAHRTPQELLAKTGEPNLDDAFIALLPEAKRAGHEKVVVRPRVAAAGRDAGYRGRGAYPALRRFRRGRPRQLSYRPRRDLRLSRLERLRQVDDDENAGRASAGLRGHVQAVRQPMGSNDMQTRRNVGYMTQAFSLYGELTVAAEPRTARAALSFADGQGSLRGSRSCSTATT